MNEKYKVILNSWGLSHLIQSFEDEGIDDTAFELLDEQTMKELIPKKGNFLIFRSKYKEYLNDKAMIEEAVNSPVLFGSSSSETQSTSSTSFTVNNELSSDSDFHQIPNLNELFEDENESSKENSTVNLIMKHHEARPYLPLNNKRPLASLFNNYMTLQELLQNSTEGRILLAKKHKLTNETRQKLVNLIIDELINECLQSKKHVELKSEKFVEISEAIQELFSGEDKDSYYIPYSKGSKFRKQPARGKLWYRYLNVKAQLRLINKEKTSIPETEPMNFSSEQKNSLDYLKKHDGEYHELLIKWEDSFDIRQFIFNDQEVHVLFREIQCSSKSFFLNLLESDFNRENPEKIDIIYSTWHKVVPAILKELESRKIAVVKEYNSFELDSDLQALCYIAYLFAPSNVKGRNFHWRPSRTEVQDSIFCLVKNEQELQEKIKRRTLFLDKGNLPLQPFGFGIIELEEIKFFIYAFENRYQVDIQNCKRSLELLYKLYQALNLEYPSEGRNIWLFLQELVFNTPPKVKNSTSSSVLCDIKHHLS